MQDCKSILITGGTGSFGRAFARELLKRAPKLERLVIYSRDELKQYEMAADFKEFNFSGLRFFIGDVRDFSRTKQALQGVDTVIHAAALKQVPAAEYNPFEFVKTNIIGAENLIQACLESGVRRVVALSTDKAAAPINLYGATKLCSDKLFIAANNIRGSKDIRFSVVRYGNVMGSRGSVIPLFLKLRVSGTLPITDPKMTRFNITLAEGVDMVFWALENALGGEIFIPKIPSYRISDLASAIGPDCNQVVVGSRPGEKIHEEMITFDDSPQTVDLGRYFAIISPSIAGGIENYKHLKGGSNVAPGFSYNSGTNPDFLSVKQIRSLIQKNIDPNFT